MKRITALLAAAVLFLWGQASAEKIITLTFTGDCTLGTEEMTRKAPESFDNVAKKKGYSYFLANFYDLFSQDDCTVVNCEGVLSDSSKGEADKDFRFRGPEEFVRILQEGSVEAVSLANNHSRDYGWKGLENTERVLDEAGIGWARADSFWIYEKDGIRIGFAGVDHGIFAESSYLLQEKLLQLKKDGEVDAIVMLIHEGKEFSPVHLGNQDKYCEYFINTAGADLVIMHHPHVVQGIRILNNRSVFYSLGNFVFGGHSKVSRGKNGTNSLYSLVVQAKMHFSDDGVYQGQQMILYPAYDSGTDPENNYQPIRLTAEEAVPVMEAIQLDTELSLPSLQTDEAGRAYAIMDYLPAAGTVLPADFQPEEGEPEAASPQPGRNR